MTYSVMLEDLKNIVKSLEAAMEKLPGYDSYLESPYQRKCEFEDRVQAEISAQDNFSGWMEWMENNHISREFELYCLENFWVFLRLGFLESLHPENAAAFNPNDPTAKIWPLWSMYLHSVVDIEKFGIMVKAFVNSNRDEFEAWAARNV